MPHCRAVGRFVVAALLAAVVVFFTPLAAWAHAELVASDPGYGARLPRAPAEVRLEFSDAMDVTGARLTLQRRGGKVEALGDPTLVSPDRRVVAVPLPPRLPDGTYTLVWLFLGNDGQLMAGEVPFEIGVPAPGPAAASGTPAGSAPAPNQGPVAVRSLGPGIAGPALEVASTDVSPTVPKRARFTIAVATPQAVVRFLDYASLAVLIGGGCFLVVVWTDGARERRVHRLLWWALAVSGAATVLTLGLTAAGLRGAGALEAFRPSIMSAVLGTRFSRILTARALFLALTGVVLAMLTLGRERAARSRWWAMLAGVACGGVLMTHALLGHASRRGFVAQVAVFVHLLGAAVWLGGLVFLVAVVLPRRRSDELRAVLPRFSRLALAAVSAMVVAGSVTLLRVVPELSRLPRSGYGRLLLLKLACVVVLLVAARQARAFTERRLVQDATRLRPLLTAVGVELTLAVVILTATAVLVGRAVPSTRTSTRTNAIATSPVASPEDPSTPKGR